MNIFNLTPTISEDTLQYLIYPSPESSDRASVTSLALFIEEAANTLLPDHIWHRDTFELKVIVNDSLLERNITDKCGSASKTDEAEGWMLEGRMRVGDSVDDEWCTVWLLREISSKCDVSIRVFDSDGEFLLIEAADQLPPWVTPENSENRVWIHKSRLHLIPISYQSSPATRPKRGHQLEEDESGLIENYERDWINVPDALRAIRENSDTRAPEEVQDIIWKRIAGYPEAARQHAHTTKAFLPVDIAKALSKKPSLVQKAVETFYTRDALQLRSANKMTRFPPVPNVLTSVRMTRTAYAQLLGQKFHPPKVFGQFRERENTKEWRWRDIGMKIACGFEMLYQESKAHSSILNSEMQESFNVARRDTLRKNTDYVAYIQRLKANGYFKNEVEGSSTWNDLENRAANAYVNTTRDEEGDRPSFARIVNECIARAGEVTLNSDVQEDSDEWLNVDAETFDENIAELMKSKSSKLQREKQTDNDMQVDKEDEENLIAQVQADKLKGLAKKVERFVEGRGSLEGALLDDDEISEEENVSEFSDEEFSSGSEDDKSQIDDEDIAKVKAIRQEAMNKLVPSLDPSEYGKMPPSFYENSQVTAPVTMNTEIHETPTPIFSMDRGNIKSIRRPIFPRDDFDGVDSDDETDEELRVLGEGNVAEEDHEESDEDRPQVVGDVEIDMSEEQEEFLEFSRTQLGISDTMWNEIILDRKKRGAFVPEKSDIKKERQKELKTTYTATAASERVMEPRIPRSGPRPNVNPNLDSFEALMEAMEEELSKARGNLRSKSSTNTQQVDKKGKGIDTSHESDESMDVDDSEIVKAMDAELRAVLKREDGDSGDEEPMDYGMIRNFLESFKSQAGLAGPVSNLAGRLEPNWALPRDS